MQMDIKYKPEIIASKDSSRPALNNVMIDIHRERTVAVASDGRRLVVVPVTIGSIHEVGPVPAEMFALSRAAARKARHLYVKIGLNGEARTDMATKGVMASTERPLEFTYPPWAGVEQAIPHGPPSLTVRFNAKFLYELATAMGAVNSVVALELHGPIDTIVVRPQGDNDAFAWLQPCRA